MKKRAKYSKNPYGFHKEVVNRKQLSRKEKLSLLRRKVRRSFGLYKRMMAADTLEELRNHQLKMSDWKAVALRGLYSYRAKKFKELIRWEHLIIFYQRFHSQSIAACHGI